MVPRRLDKYNVHKAIHNCSYLPGNSGGGAMGTSSYEGRWHTLLLSTETASAAKFNPQLSFSGPMRPTLWCYAAWSLLYVKHTSV